MVHLTAIPERPAKPTKKTQVQLATAESDFTSSVYGSSFADQDLPRHEMPEQEMPRDIAYRMIKDELSLDNNPKLK